MKQQIRFALASRW